MSWELIILLLASIATGFVYVIDKKISNGKHQADAYTILTLSLNLIVAVPLLLVNFYMSSNPWIWLMVIVSGALYGTSRFFIYKAYQNSDASTVGIIHKFTIVLGAILGIIIFNETYSGISYIGLTLITASSILILYDGKRIQLDKGAIYAFIMVVLSSFAAILDKAILKDFSAYTYVFVNAVASVIFFTGKKGIFKKGLDMFKDHKFPVILRTVLVMGSYTGFLVFLQKSQVSVSFPIYKSLSLIVPVVLGITLLKEKSRLWQKLLGMIIGIAGIILIAYS